MPTQEEVVQALGQMNVMELIALTRTLEEQWGVKAVPQAAPVPTVVPLPFTEEEKTEFDVILLAIGDRKIDVMKAIRTATGLGLKEAKDFTDNLPKSVKEALPKADAEALKVQLEAVGAKVELK